MKPIMRTLAVLFALSAVLAMIAAPSNAAGKPNILVIWGDDIGRDNISAYSLGIISYQTPNIDRIAKEGRCFPLPPRRATSPLPCATCPAGR